MKICRGIDGGWYAVFRDNMHAEAYAWFFVTICQRGIASYGQYENAYRLI